MSLLLLLTFDYLLLQSSLAKMEMVCWSMFERDVTLEVSQLVEFYNWSPDLSFVFFPGNLLKRITRAFSIL